MTRNTPHSIRLDLDGRTARLTLDRPERHNAFEAGDVDAFHGALDEVEDSPARVLMLTGSGNRTFSSGASLDQMKSGEMDGARFTTMTDRLHDFPLPTVCALNGRMYGGGGELALSCDFRIGSPDTALRVTAAALGIGYPVEGIVRYVTRLGPGAASRILVAAEEIDGAELHRVGFLTHLAADGAVEADADALCERLGELAPMAVRAMKLVISEASAGRLDPEAAAARIRACAASEDMREGLAAWQEGRAPDFRGR